MEKELPQQKFNTGRWTTAEHNKFLKALEKYGRNWDVVQQKVKTRSLLQVRSHAQKIFLNMPDEDIDAIVGFQEKGTQLDRLGAKINKRAKRLRITQENSIQKYKTENQQQQNFLGQGQVLLKKQDQTNLSPKLFNNQGSEIFDKNAVSQNVGKEQPKSTHYLIGADQYIFIPMINPNQPSSWQGEQAFGFLWNPTYFCTYQV